MPRSTALVEERGPENKSRHSQLVPPVDDGIVHDHPSESGTESVEFKPRRRRLVLCSQSGSLPPPLEGITEMVAAPWIQCQLRCSCRWRAFGLQILDLVDLVHVFEVKAMVMRSIPQFMRGVFRGAMKVGFHEITKGRAANNIQVESQGWKLFMLLPRLLLYKPSRGGLILKGRLKERVTMFCAGEWIPLFGSVDGGRFGRKLVLPKPSDEDVNCRVQGQRELLGWRSWGSSQVHVKRWKVQRLLLVMRKRGRPSLMRPRGLGGRGTPWKTKFSQWFLLILWSWTSSG